MILLSSSVSQSSPSSWQFPSCGVCPEPDMIHVFSNFQSISLLSMFQSPLEPVWTYFIGDVFQIGIPHISYLLVLLVGWLGFLGGGCAFLFIWTWHLLVSFDGPWILYWEDLYIWISALKCTDIHHFNLCIT